jgi:Chitin binding Peritrophin-A domain.
MSSTTKEPCNVTIPNQPHPRDCHSFYKCVPGTNGPELVENNCGANMLYSPSLEACDLPAIVISERPECSPAETTQGTTKWTSESTKNIATSSTMSTPFTEEITTPCEKYSIYYFYIMFIIYNVHVIL